MTADPAEPPPGSTELAVTRTDLADERTALAYDRTRLASDRTTMGYLRTAISLIGFGFSIPAFFQVITNVPGMESISPTAPRMLGLALLVLAIVMMSVATVQQGLFLRRLEQKSGMKHPFSIALASCMFVLVVALMAVSHLALQIGRS
jgi:putative membrane protein